MKTIFSYWYESISYAYMVQVYGRTFERIGELISQLPAWLYLLAGGVFASGFAIISSYAAFFAKIDETAQTFQDVENWKTLGVSLMTPEHFLFFTHVVSIALISILVFIHITRLLTKPEYSSWYIAFMQFANALFCKAALTVVSLMLMFVGGNGFIGSAGEGFSIYYLINHRLSFKNLIHGMLVGLWVFFMRLPFLFVTALLGVLCVALPIVGVLFAMFYFLHSAAAYVLLPVFFFIAPFFSALFYTVYETTYDGARGLSVKFF